MLRIRIGHDENTASWLTLPEKPGRIGMLYMEIQGDAPADAPMTIYETESSVSTLPEVLRGMRTDEKSVRALECLAKRLEYLTAAEQELFSAALKYEAPESAKDILNISYNLDNYEFAADSSGLNQAGQGVWKPEGRTFQEVYDGERLPEAGYDKNSVFLLYLYTGKKRYPLAVPTTPEKMEMAKAALGVKNLNQCNFNQFGGPCGELWDYLPINNRLKEVNRMAAVLKEKVLDGSKHTVKLLKAAFLAECPRTIGEAVTVARNLRNYELMEEGVEPETYAREAVRRYGDSSLEPLLERYVDWEAMGKAMMDAHGVVQTEFGIVACKKWCCERLSDETVLTRLYSQVTGDLFDSEDRGESCGAYQMVWYEKQIREALEKDGLFRVKHGLAEYLDHELLKQRIVRMHPTVEAYHHSLWGVLEVETRGELTAEEMDYVKEYWKGQAADGWGEGFEQRDIKCEDGCSLNVHFYNSSMLYGIRTEQELKGMEEVQQGPQMGGIS